MANLIVKNDKVIWKCSNTMLDIIYKTIHEIIKIKKIEPASSVYKFVEALNQDVYGAGCIYVDIEDFFKIADELSIFSEILKLAIEKINKEVNWPEERYKHALHLYLEFIKLCTISK